MFLGGNLSILLRMLPQIPNSPELRSQPSLDDLGVLAEQLGVDQHATEGDGIKLRRIDRNAISLKRQLRANIRFNCRTGSLKMPVRLSLAVLHGVFTWKILENRRRI